MYSLVGLVRLFSAFDEYRSSAFYLFFFVNSSLVGLALGCCCEWERFMFVSLRWRHISLYPYLL
jgi:hypothetical protein